MQSIIVGYLQNIFGFSVSNGYSRIRRGESYFSQKWPLASVGESGESLQYGSANVASLASLRNTPWRMSASLASPRNTAWRMSASLAWGG